MAISRRRFSPRLRFLTSRLRTAPRSNVSSASTILGFAALRLAGVEEELQQATACDAP